MLGLFCCCPLCFRNILFNNIILPLLRFHLASSDSNTDG